MKRAFVSTSPLFSLFWLRAGGLRNPWSVTQELRRVRPANRPPLSQKSGWEKRGETSGGKQREAVSNKDAGEQSAVSQIWGGKRDEEEDASPQTADIKMKSKNLRQLFFFFFIGSSERSAKPCKNSFCSSGSSDLGHLSGLLEKNYRNHNST